MEDNTTNLGLWAVTAPPPPSLTRFEGEESCDVAVIGGGFTGVSAALHLAEAGIDVVLLEAKELGHGGSGRNVGLVNAGLWVLPDYVTKTLGPDYGEKLNTALGNSPYLVFELIQKHSIKCEAMQNGTLHCAHSPRGYRYLKNKEEQWARRGAPVKLLSRQEAEPKIGSTAYHGALMDMRAGIVQPLAYVRGLAQAAVGAGARLYVDSPVTRLEHQKGLWSLSLPSGVLKARGVIVAANGYPDGALKGLKENFIPFNYFQFSTPPLPERVLNTVLPERNGTWDTHLVLSSYRLDQSGRLIVGSVGRADGSAHGLHLHWAERMLGRVFPQIGRVRMEHSWHGTISMTTDHIPRFHILGPDCVMITGYNGRGIGPGTVCGKLLANFLMEGSEKDMPLPVSKPHPVFLRRLRELYYESGARMYHFLQKRVLP